MAATGQTDEGMGAGTKALLVIGALVAAAWLVPYLADLAAANPERLRKVAAGTRRVRSKAIRKGTEGVERGARYLRDRFA